MRELFKPGWIAAYCILAAVALWVRVPHFTHHALIGPDGAEYVYCVQKHWLPHSPYVVYFWAGWLIDWLVPLDWGYSALSEVSSLLSLPIFGATLAVLAGSTFAGFAGATVLAFLPVCIRFAGLQEVYAFQFLWIALSWYAAAVSRSPFRCGLFLGLAFATHSGTLFAIPTTLLFLRQSTVSPLREAEEDKRRWLDWVGPLRTWLVFVGAFLLPIALAALWLLYLWFMHHGLEKIDLYFRYLRGAAPSPDIGKLIGEGAPAYWRGQIERLRIDLATFEAVPLTAILGGTISLLLQRPSRSLPWLILAIPYLIYEAAIGYTVDLGIYIVFLAPSLAAGVAWGVENLVRVPKFPLTWATAGAAAAALVGLGLSLPPLQALAAIRNEYPWMKTEGAPMALSRWLKENSPPETLVIQPVDWDPPMMAAALYADRIQLFNDGYVLNPAPWRPFCTAPEFEHVRQVTSQMLLEWIREERPLVCFDPDPFWCWGCWWEKVDAALFEVRPLLWLDRNQSGTSQWWDGNFDTLARIDIGDVSEEERFSVDLPAGAGRATVALPMFHPTLYYLVEKGAPEEAPEWVRDFRSKVSPEQWGAPPQVEEDGIGFKFEGEGVSMTIPTVPGKNHLLRARLNTQGDEYLLECQVRQGKNWTATGRDMEKIVVEPIQAFTDFYFPIPANRIEGASTQIRILPAGETQWMNLYDIEVGVAGIRGASEQ